MTVCTGFLADNWRVVLFSNPQQILAANANSAPLEKDSAEKSSTVHKTEAAVINTTAAHSRLLTVSLNNQNAINAVAAISKLFSSATVAGVVVCSPQSNSIGAAASSSTIAASHGKSLPDSAGAEGADFAGNTYTASMPSPAPQYSKEAKNAGEICRRSSLEKGALKP